MAREREMTFEPDNAAEIRTGHLAEITYKYLRLRKFGSGKKVDMGRPSVAQ